MKEQEFDPLRREILDAVSQAESRDQLEQVRVGALGRKGRVTQLMKTLGTLEAEARRAAGAALNRLKDEVEAAIAAAADTLMHKDIERRLAGERVDVTLPVEIGGAGRVHPISQTTDELTAIFGERGFKNAEGPPTPGQFSIYTP